MTPEDYRYRYVGGPLDGRPILHPLTGRPLNEHTILPDEIGDVADGGLYRYNPKTEAFEWSAVAAQDYSP